MKDKLKNVRRPPSPPMSGSIKNLDLQCKQSIVDLMMDVQCGNVSCRRAATEIQRLIPKRHLTMNERNNVRADRAAKIPVSVIAQNYNINESTVWRICKSNGQNNQRRLTDDRN